MVLTDDLLLDRRIGDVYINDILTFLSDNEQIDSVLPWDCSVTDHRSRQM